MSDQAASLRRKLQISKNPREAKTLSFISGKGGVGKSNIALNFSLELIKNDQKVLLFDLDVGMGNIDILLGLNSDKTIIDMFNEQLSIHDIIETGPRNLAYIAGGSGLSEFFNLNADKKDYFIRQYMELVQMYDYIIFDMGAGATKDSIFFILASDECIVITTPEPTSITDAYGMIKHVAANQPDMPIFAIMNRCGTQKEGEKSLERFKTVIAQFLHIEIQMMGILPEDKMVTNAVRKQIPFILLNERSAAGKAVQQLTENYLSKSREMNNIGNASFIQKLKQFITKEV
ncbi:MinD/ParA family protein [Virgibacillus indicus]|nr:MinD/ParA family protein [Virgibacillus indicus]